VWATSTPPPSTTAPKTLESAQDQFATNVAPLAITPLVPLNEIRVTPLQIPTLTIHPLSLPR
jgi:hypothetical protein